MSDGSRSPLQSEADLAASTHTAATIAPATPAVAPAAAPSRPLSPSPDPVALDDSITPVERFLRANDLGQYIRAFADKGYDDVEDVVELVYGDPTLFKQIVVLPGHRAKIMRLLKSTPSDGSPSPFRRAASSRMTEAGESVQSSVAALPRIASFHNNSPTTQAPPGAKGSGSDLSGMLAAPADGDDRPRSLRRSMGSGMLTPRGAGGGGSNNGSFQDLAALGIDSPVTATPLPLKVVVIGQSGVGKSSFIGRLVRNEFNSNFRSTLGVEFSEKKFRVGSRTLVALHLWDIFGQSESAPQLTRSYYNHAKGALVFYDVSDRSSLDCAIRWKQDIDAKVRFNGTTLPVPVLLVGNKVDMPVENVFWGRGNPAVPSISNTSDFLAHPAVRDEIQAFCNEHRFTGHFFVSAKNNVGIREVAEFMIHAILKMDPMTTDPRATNNVVTLDAPQTRGKGGTGHHGTPSPAILSGKSRSARGADAKKKGGFFSKC